MANFQSFSGMITNIDDFWTDSRGPTGCNKIMTIEDREGKIVNFVVKPTTYFVRHVMATVGETFIGFYDADAPTPMIYPPQLQAVVMARESRRQNVKVAYFDSQLLSRDGALKLNVSPETRMVLENGQRFTGNPANRYLIVLYGPTTRSIPPQTSPDEIIVMC